MIASLQERETNKEVGRAEGHRKDGLHLAHPLPLASREMRDVRTVVNVAGVLVGGSEVVVIAGPCSVESREQLLETARAVKRAGASVLRGGAYKPRTSPYDFQGLGLEALRLLGEAREETGLPVVTEVLSTDDVDVVAEYADMLQVGARNMQNFALLSSESSLRGEEFGVEYGGPGSAADGVVAECDKAVVENAVGPKTTDGDAHAAPCVAVELGLRAVWLVAHDDWPFGRGVQLQLLRQRCEGRERLAQ